MQGLLYLQAALFKLHAFAHACKVYKGWSKGNAYFNFKSIRNNSLNFFFSYKPQSVHVEKFVQLPSLFLPIILFQNGCSFRHTENELFLERGIALYIHRRNVYGKAALDISKVGRYIRQVNDKPRERN